MKKPDLSDFAVVKIQELNNISTSAGSFKQFSVARNRVGTGLSYRPTRAGILEQSVGARNRVGIEFLYQPPEGYIQ